VRPPTRGQQGRLRQKCSVFSELMSVRESQNPPTGRVTRWQTRAASKGVTATRHVPRSSRSIHQGNHNSIGSQRHDRESEQSFQIACCAAGNVHCSECASSGVRRQERIFLRHACRCREGGRDHSWLDPRLRAHEFSCIHIVYDPSSPRTWCAFEFSPADSQSLKKNLTSADVLPQELKRVDSPGAPWWPDFLKGDLDVARFHGNGFDAYVGEESDVQSSTDLVLFAIDWTKGRAFFYRTPCGTKNTGTAGGGGHP
jgi:hypothetical protein